MEVAVFPETTLTDYEIERGKPMPSRIHALVQKRLAVFLDNNYSSRFEGYTELTLNTPGEKSTPDIALLPIEEIDWLHDEIKVSEAPLLTVEILSPRQSVQSLLDKTEVYFDFGVKSCWVVLPSLKTIYVFAAPGQYQPFHAPDTLHDPNLDIHIPLEKIFS
ncbi:MAG: Uma2 family endonuclease [Saprospiraceae bacterium]